MFVICLSYVYLMFVICLPYVCHMFVICLSYVCLMFALCLPCLAFRQFVQAVCLSIGQPSSSDLPFLPYIILLTSMKGRGRLSVSVSDLNDDNEFMEGDFGGQPGLKSRAVSKNIRVKKLEQRNVKLQDQVIRIERALSHGGSKMQYGVRLPDIKSDVMRKQLENAFKQIKQYEHEVKKRKRFDNEQSFVEQVRKLEEVMKEKLQLAQKLRKEVHETKKASIELVRCLKNDTLKKEQIEKEVTVNADIKWLHQKIKRNEAKSMTADASIQRQQAQLQRIEHELTSHHGMQASDLQNIRNKLLNATSYPQPNANESDDALEAAEDRDELLLEERTQATFSLMMNEVKLFRKLGKDYEGRIQLLTREKQESEDRNFRSRNRLVETQYEIQRFEAAIAEQKKLVDPRNLVPTKLDMFIEEKRRLAASKASKPKLSMAHSYKFKEVGEATKAGKRFIDRSAIGKRPAKIIGATFYERRDGEHELMGLQVTYLVGSIRKKGSLNVLADISTLEARECSLEPGDFIRSMDVLTDSRGAVAGLSMVSGSNVVLKGGAMTSSRQPIEMQPDEYPVCVYGCLLPDGIEMLGTEMVQH